MTYLYITLYMESWNFSLYSFLFYIKTVMKVLQINKFLYPKGGAEAYIFQLSTALKEHGIEVDFWGMQDDKNIINDTYKSFTKHVNYQHTGFLNNLSNTQKTIYSVENRKKLSLILDQFKPDLVHLHNYNFQLTPSILPEIKKRGIKIIQTIHDSQMICPYHRLYNFQRDKICTKCVTGSFYNCISDKCFDGSYVKSFIGASESYFYHNMGYYEKYIDQFISPSRFLSDLVKKRVKNKTIEIIPNFFDKPDKITNQKGDFYLYYGRISGEKGILELVEIFKELKFNLIIIGGGSLESELVHKIKDITNISYLGSKSKEDLFSYVSGAKYVIQPAKWYENCPMTVIESFAFGTPVIASDHSGFKDLIQDRETGFLLDFTNINQARKAIKEIDNENRALLKQNINRFFQKKLKKEIHLSGIIKIYKQLTQR